MCRSRVYAGNGVRMKRFAVAMVLGAILLAALPRCLSAAELVAINAPRVSREETALATQVSDLLDQATALIGRLYPGTLEPVEPDGAKPAEYSLSTIASQDKDSLSLAISMTRIADGSKTPTLGWSGPATPDLPLWIARSAFLLWSSFHGYLSDQAAEAPAFVDDLPGSALDPTMPPMGITTTQSGTLALAMVTGCLELDHTYRLVSEPGKSLSERSAPTYIVGVAATPGGSFILKPSMGRDLYRVQPNAVEPQRVPTGLELSLIFYWTALPDGSALLVDATNRRAYRAAPGKKRQEVPLFPDQSSWPTAYATGPDGTIWVYDPRMRGVRIFTAEGNPLDIILPLTDPAIVLAATSMAVGPDGSFVIFSSGSLYEFRADGRLAWVLDSLPGSEQRALSSSTQIAVDWSRGLIYLCDVPGRRITKLIDRAWCRQKGLRNDFEEKVITLRRGLVEDEPGTYAQVARLYEGTGSMYMAKAYWQKVEDVEPGNPDAGSRLRAIEMEELKAAARALDAKARSTLATIGIETARPLSIQAIQKYELLLSKAPDDEREREAMEDLRRLFSETGRTPDRRPPLSITTFRVANLFPSLMQWYASHPSGAVTVKNPLAVAVENVRASLFIPGFMELPSDSRTLARLEPAGSASFDLAPVFSQKVLELQEDMTVQAQLVVAWTVNGEEQTASRAAAVTIYRNSALTWDDTRKISSFVTPNEATVNSFAARVLAGPVVPPQPRFSRTLFQAMRICDALGVYGIAYVQDPDSPFSRALGRAEIVDTVRFPRVTLSNRTGDCDDTTALLSSLLESAGIHTAVLTTPGHVFLAFDTGEPVENAQYLANASLQVISRNAAAWIPVETTVLSQGFMAAWESASALVKKYAATGPFELIPLSSMRDVYPALPLPPSSLAIAEPAQAGVERASAASLKRFVAALYTERLKDLDARLAGLSGKAAVMVRVQQGIVHALFGKLAEAEASFRRAIADEPSLISPYVNLANIRLLSRDGDGALLAVKQGLARNGDSALLNLLAARIYADKGDAAMTARYYARVQKSAPDLAARFADLLPVDGRPQRAAGSGQAPTVIWGSDQ